jgi:hypothetical protein
MKTKIIVKRLLLALVLAACWLGLGGCIVLPEFSTTVRSPDVRGRVVDLETREPVENVRIFWHDYTNEMTTTDTNGNFHLPGVNNRHYLYVGCYAGIYGWGGAHYPQGATPCYSIGINHPDYWDGYSIARSYSMAKSDGDLQPGSDRTGAHQVLGDILLRSQYPQLTQQLIDASRKGDLAAMNLLITEHPKLVEKTMGKTSGSTSPLHLAADNGDVDVIRVLLAHGANVNARNSGGMTPLMDASLNGRTEVVKLLLANRADVSLKDYSSNTALDYARGGHWPEVERILKGQGEQTHENLHNQAPPK